MLHAKICKILKQFKDNSKCLTLAIPSLSTEVKVENVKIEALHTQSHDISCEENHGKNQANLKQCMYNTRMFQTTKPY